MLMDIHFSQFLSKKIVQLLSRQRWTGIGKPGPLTTRRNQPGQAAPRGLVRKTINGNIKNGLVKKTGSVDD
jgi:hypothetical protein